MRTLSKAITSQFYTTTDGYDQLTKRWSELIASKHELDSVHYLLYQIFRGKDWTKSISTNNIVLTNKNKLSSGGAYNTAIYKDLITLRNSYSRINYLMAPFEGIIKPETLKLIQKLIPTSCYSDIETTEVNEPYNASMALSEEIVLTILPLKEYVYA